MAYQVIARKYRPQRFSDVVGQEHVTQTLTNAIQQNRIAHAYLFVGPRGTGKTTIARIFAKCLNCQNGPSVEFRDDDPFCQEITDGRSLDVLEVDGASNRGIEEVRALRETVKYAPATCRFKIYIIDEVHMLTKEAFNALLKTLEEPPEHVKFMFATTEPEKVLATILSRCQRFDLQRIPVALIVRHLAKIAGQEKVTIDEPALHAIARGAEGGMRDAESALDQLISFCGGQIVESDVLAMFGLTARAQILALSTAMLQGNTEAVLRELHQLSKHGKDLGRLLADLLDHFRNLLIYKFSQGDLSLLEISENEKESLAAQAPLARPEALIRMLEVLTDSEHRLREAASKKIFLEVALLRTIQAQNAIAIDTLLAQLQALRAGQSNPGASPPGNATARTAGPVAAPARPSAAAPSVERTAVAHAPAPLPPEPGPVDNLQQLWQNLLEAVGRASAFTRSYLVEAAPVSLAKGVLTIGFDPEFSERLELVDNQRTRALLQTKLEEMGHPNLQIKFTVAEQAPVGRAAAPGPAPAAPDPPGPAAQPEAAAPAAAAGRTKAKRAKAPPQKLSLEEFKNDPLIKSALEIFKGQIVEVRS